MSSFKARFGEIAFSIAFTIVGGAAVVPAEGSVWAGAATPGGGSRLAGVTAAGVAVRNGLFAQPATDAITIAPHNLAA